MKDRKADISIFPFRIFYFMSGHPGAHLTPKRSGPGRTHESFTAGFAYLPF